MPTDKKTFAEKYPGAEIFLRERTGGAVLLAVAPLRMAISIEGTIQSEDIVNVLKDAREAGLFKDDNFSALVDMTNFTGVIDWRKIPEISEVMPKGETRTNKNAYVVRNDFFAMLAKINAVLFPKTLHATFKTEEEARLWLGWK